MQDDPELLERIKKFGERSSSFMMSFPHFRSFQNGNIRFISTKKAWIGANEPLTEREKKSEVFQLFHEAAARVNKKALMLPVSQEWSEELEKKGYHRMMIGSEAIFDLDLFFSGSDPLNDFPRSKTLKLKGFKVEELDPFQMSENQKRQIDRLTEEWKKVKRDPMGFLGPVDPWHLRENRRLLVLKQFDRIHAYISAVPIYVRNGFFFSDIITEKNKRSGLSEFFVIEAMRTLYQKGSRQVSLGLCPLARIHEESKRGVRNKIVQLILKTIYQYVQAPYSFRTLFEFKNKFQPTSWKRMYVVSKDRINIWSLLNLAKIHFKNILGGFQIDLNWIEKPIQSAKRKNLVLCPIPTRFSELLHRTQWTSLLCLSFISLHVLRVQTGLFDQLFQRSAFTTNSLNEIGIFLGPFFHNNIYHLMGDVLTFFLIGGLIEVLLGKKWFWALTAIGLWVSNPLCWLISMTLVSGFSHLDFTPFFELKDYGSSNATYAFAGAFAGILRKPIWILLPFLLNGLVVSTLQQNILAIHHGVALMIGFWLVRDQLK